MNDFGRGGGGGYQTLSALTTKWKKVFLYSVVQSDRNSCCLNLVLDSFNMAFRDEDSIIDQMYANKYFWIFIIKIKNFKSDWRKYITKV